MVIGKPHKKCGPLAEQSSSSRQRFLTLSSCAITIGFCSLFLSYFAIRFGLNTPPSATGDEPSYDSIGWQLHLGNGFREDFEDPRFRAPYEIRVVDDAERMTLPTLPSGTITYRPPLFPALIAVTDLLFGRQFFAVRAINVLAMCIAGGLVWYFLYARFGLAAAVSGAVLFFGVDVRTRLYARAILTESLAVLLMTIVSLLLIQLIEQRRVRTAGLLGIVLGLSMLNRTAFVLWLPLLVIGLAALTLSRGALERRRISQSSSGWAGWGDTILLKITAVLVLTSVFVYLPWGLRNIRVLGHFMPMGTQGLMELSAAFSDEAYRRQGVWFNLQQLDFYGDVDQPGMTRIEQELARAHYSRHRALEWIRSNPLKAMTLGFMKVIQEYRPRSSTEVIIGLLAVAGLAVIWRSIAGQVFLMLHGINGLMIAATWSVEGRFVVPLLFSIHVLAAVGLCAVVGNIRTAVFKPRSFRLHPE